jgi:hypothetical protein
MRFPQRQLCPQYGKEGRRILYLSTSPSRIAAPKKLPSGRSRCLTPTIVIRKWALERSADRALKTGLPIAIEQDLAWYMDKASGKSWSVVVHHLPPSGSEPTLKTYFFETDSPDG